MDSGEINSLRELEEIVTVDIRKFLSRKVITSKTFSAEFGKQLLPDHATLYELICQIRENDNDGLRWVEGVVLGLLVYQACKDIKELPNNFVNGDLSKYDLMMGSHYAFNPHHLFKISEFDFDNFEKSLIRFSLNIFREQYKYSLRRIQSGQNAKFLSVPYDNGTKIKFEVPSDLVEEKAGVLDFIQSILDLWQSAKLIRRSKNSLERNI